MPSADPTVSAFIMIALIGSTIEPVISHRTIIVSATSSPTPSGRLEPIAACWSMNAAAAPPTSTDTGSARRSRTTCAGDLALRLAGREHVHLPGRRVQRARLGHRSHARGRSSDAA